MSTPNPTAVTPAPSAMGWSCGLCRFTAVMSNGTLQCRHDPPTVAVQGTTTQSVWPGVQATDWCGDYEPAPT